MQFYIDPSIVAQGILAEVRYPEQPEHVLHSMRQAEWAGRWDQSDPPALAILPPQKLIGRFVIFKGQPGCIPFQIPGGQIFAKL